MKKIRTFIIVFFALGVFGIANAQSKKTKTSASKFKYFTNIEIKQRFVETARVTAGNVDAEFNKDRKWLQIDITYVTTRAPLKGFSRKFQWLDDFVIRVELILDSVHRGTKVKGLMSGEAEYWSVALDGKKHYAQFFVNPYVLERYVSPDVKLKNAYAKKIPTRVAFYNRNNQIIAYKFFVPRDRTESAVAKTFVNLDKSLGGFLKLEDTIFSRNKTPWGVLNFDKYELIKTDTGRRRR